MDARQVAARPLKASDETIPHWVAPGYEDDGDRRGCGLGHLCRRAIHRGDDCDLSANQIDR
jgi:hypothetical protein